MHQAALALMFGLPRLAHGIEAIERRPLVGVFGAHQRPDGHRAVVLILATAGQRARCTSTTPGIHLSEALRCLGMRE
jgi:hypothetical protein